MSQIAFAYSNKKLPDCRYIEPINLQQFDYTSFPYLAGKKYLYEMHYPLSPYQAQEFMSYLTTRESIVYIVILEQTDKSEKITEFNTRMRDCKEIDVLHNNNEYYEFKYNLEYGKLKPKTEYKIIPENF